MSVLRSADAKRASDATLQSELGDVSLIAEKRRRPSVQTRDRKFPVFVGKRGSWLSRQPKPREKYPNFVGKRCCFPGRSLLSFGDPSLSPQLTSHVPDSLGKRPNFLGKRGAKRRLFVGKRMDDDVISDEEEEPVLEDDSSELAKRPNFLGKRPSFIGKRPSFIGKRPSFIGKRPSFIGKRPSFLGKRSAGSEDSDASAQA